MRRLSVMAGSLFLLFSLSLPVFCQFLPEESAAYQFDKDLGFNMVVPTVGTRFHEYRGSCQLWVPY